MTIAFVPFTSDHAVGVIGRGLIDRTLPKPAWTHAAHFAAALWLIRERPDLTPARDMPPLIRAYNEATGVANTDEGGYHETITQASLRAARAFLAERPAGELLFETCNALMASPLGKTDWLLSYWTKGRLFSVAARRGWIEPDLQPLPF
jgi:hypothetical protein